MTVRVLPKGAAPPEAIDVTTHGSAYRPLSPMLLGPVMLYGGLYSETMENAWQYAKMYPGYEGFEAYWPWATAGWASKRAVRYPMGRGAKPRWSVWAGDRLGYVAARRRIYIPLYAQAVRFHQLVLFERLRAEAFTHDLVLTDFDAYDHRALGYSWEDVINDEKRRMGHGFVLAMMIEGYL